MEHLIAQSPFITEVKRSVWAILSSVYYKPSAISIEEKVLEAERYVLENGIFIGAMSKHGFFICEDLGDVLDSFWITIARELDVDEKPGKIFLKRMKELYAQAETKFQ